MIGSIGQSDEAMGLFRSEGMTSRILMIVHLSQITRRGEGESTEQPIAGVVRGFLHYTQDAPYRVPIILFLLFTFRMPSGSSSLSSTRCLPIHSLLVQQGQPSDPSSFSRNCGGL